MEDLEALRGRIDSARGLLSVVKNMKAFSALNLRRYEQAMEALAEYYRTVTLGLGVVLKHHWRELAESGRETGSGQVLVVFGSDQGFAGQFNEAISSHALETSDLPGSPSARRELWAVGAKVGGRLSEVATGVGKVFPTPSNIDGITDRVGEMLLAIEERRAKGEIDAVALFYNRPHGGASFRPHADTLLPLNQRWAKSLAEKPWPSRVLPTHTMDWAPLFASLVRGYLFVSLYRAYAASLASENASRLASMQKAEKNIEERLAELRTEFNRMRQDAITGELFDIIAGYEVLTKQV